MEITAEELLIKVARITQLSQPVTISNLPQLQLRDPKDKIVLEAALGVPVEVIVSGDEDLLILGEFKKIPILTTQVQVFHDRTYGYS